MALFQEAIIKKHLNLIDDKIIEQAFSEYKRVYSPDKIKNIPFNSPVTQFHLNIQLKKSRPLVN